MRSLVFVFLVGSTWVQAQNLVPNGSFEEYSACPTYFGAASWCTGWQNLYTQSADYFNSCHTNGIVGIPLNYFGYQYPYDGEGYMGFCTYQFNQHEYREMVGIPLTEPLQIGVPVCLSFKMAVGGFGTSPGASAGYTCKGVGMKFFNAQPTGQYIYDYPNSAALYLNEVPTDTAIWYQVEGQYVPDSAYTYLVLGNFFADSLNQPTIQDSIGSGAADWAYAFVDDVRASFDLNYCTLTQSGSESQNPQPVCYPIPASDVLYVRMPASQGGALHYVLCDIAGRCVQSGTAVRDIGDQSISLGTLPVGVYMSKLSTTERSWAPITFVHISP